MVAGGQKKGKEQSEIRWGQGVRDKGACMALDDER